MITATSIGICILSAVAAISVYQEVFVGYEMLADPQRDLTPEASAERLKRC